MESMRNVVISHAERGKSGQASWGSWQAWSIYFVGMESKFDYFERDGIIPFDGMQVELVGYEVRQDGRYTNYKIKKIVPAKLTDSGLEMMPAPAGMGKAKAPRPSPVMPFPNRFEIDKRLTMCTSYAKDIMVQVLAGGSYSTESFSDIIDLVAKGGRRLAEKLNERTEAPKAAILTHEKPVVVTPAIPEVPVTPEMTISANEVLSSCASDTPVVSEPVITSDDVPF